MEEKLIRVIGANVNAGKMGEGDEVEADYRGKGDLSLAVWLLYLLSLSLYLISYQC